MRSNCMSACRRKTSLSDAHSPLNALTRLPAYCTRASHFAVRLEHIPVHPIADQRVKLPKRAKGKPAVLDPAMLGRRLIRFVRQGSIRLS